MPHVSVLKAGRGGSAILGALVSCVLVLGGPAASAQEFPGFENPSPTAGSSTSDKANATADKAGYKSIDYPNRGVKGPQIIVLPGQVKSNNSSFVQRFGPNNIADFAELELGKANFGVLERANLAPILDEFTLAYNLGDTDEVRKYLGKGKLKSTKWVIKFDILKAEQVSEAKESVDGRALGSIFNSVVGGVGGAVGGTAVGSVQTAEQTGVWLIGMRYKIINAETTEQVATNYFEQKMEIGAKGGSFLGFGSSESGGLTLDGMVQRLVQQSVWDIDTNYK